mmetsp:Transcript_61061/g.132374  ORF Transcript_61061/g.132374 Transcript_61061/m.132374 type:complete len:117 (+) Transcript_61061:74-424(+)
MGSPNSKGKEDRTPEEVEGDKEEEEREKKQGPRASAYKIGGICGYFVGTGFGAAAAAVIMDNVGVGGLLLSGPAGILAGVLSSKVLYERGHSDEGAGLTGGLIGGIVLGMPVGILL